MAEPNKESSTFSPPYVSFRTLLNALDRMGAEGVPSRLDRSYLSNLPWSTQNHFLAACRTIGLIDEAGSPKPVLISLVEKPEERPELFAKILRDFYAGPMSLRSNATQAELEERFREYGLSGSTSRKSIAFFLHAAAYAKVPLSPHFRSPRTTGRPAAKRGKRPKPASAGSAAEVEIQPPVPAPSPLQLHPFVEGLLRELPPDGAWSKEKRDRWLKMAELTVDMIYQVEPQE